MLFAVLVLSVSLCGVSAFKELPNRELLYARVVSRHGDRTPDIDELATFTSDIVVSDETYYPFGLGALTNAGKARAYLIGKRMRERYDKFLNETYWPGDIRPIATAYDRARMTLQCAMAALYPPVPSQRWSNNLNWQPIPYETQSKASDPMVPTSSCPRYTNALYATVAQLATDPEQIARYGKELARISELSGFQFTNIIQLTGFVGALKGNENYGIRKPRWAEEMWPLLTQLDDAGFRVFVQTDEMIRLSGGKILQDFIDISKNIVSGGQGAPKLDFLSGHDSNVIAMLAASCADIELRRPQYTATFFMELYKNNKSGGYEVALAYARSADEQPKLLPVKGCSAQIPCPLDTFIEITAKYAVTNYTEACTV